MSRLNFPKGFLFIEIRSTDPKPKVLSVTIDTNDIKKLEKWCKKWMDVT